MKKEITIIGFGRFGKTLARLLSGDFVITAYDAKSISRADARAYKLRVVHDIKDAYANKTIFYAVPIGVFEQVIAEHKKYFRDDHVLIDVLSVKVHPARVFRKHLRGRRTQAILTHPMFGPDSSKNGFADLPIIMNRFMARQATYKYWVNYFRKKKLRVVDLTPHTHDRFAARSQGLTHFIGRLLGEVGFHATPIDSLGAQKLLEVKEQVTHDTWQLFWDLQHFNPYTATIRAKLGDAHDKLYHKLLPSEATHGYVTYGIQGGKGSFNEEAIRHYLERKKIEKYKISYLHTSENVLRALAKGEIDYGQFALHNSVGGIVDESVEAMGRHHFRVADKVSIKIAHALMMRADANFKGITTIMTHPQVLAQCRATLAQKYPNLTQTSGKGKLIDHALVAKQLGAKKLPKHIAVMGSRVLAELYGLRIIEDNLQDAKENYTSFLLVARPRV